MSTKDQSYHPVDEFFKSNVQKIPVTFKPQAWEKLSSQLDEHDKISKLPKGGWKKWTFNIFIGILLLSIVTTTLVVYASNTKSNSAMPMKINHTEKNELILREVNQKKDGFDNSQESVVNPTQKEITPSINKKTTPTKEEVPSTDGIPLPENTTNPKDTVSKSPYIFW